MTLEPMHEKITPAGLKRLCMHQAVVEARLLTSGGVLISKVLSIAADCTVSSGEVFTGEARYSGRVNFKVIYTCTEGKNHSMDYNADFTDKMLCDGLKAGMRPFVSAHILDTDIVAVDEREIKLACVVESAFDAVVEDSHSAIISLGEGIYTHEAQVEHTRHVSQTSAPFTLSDTVNLKGANILLSEARVVTTTRTASFDSIIIEGNVLCDLTCELEDGMIYSIQHTTPFKEEIPCNEVRDNHLILASVNLSRHSVTVESSDDKHSALLEFSLESHVKAFVAHAQTVVIDAFSVTHDLSLIGEEITLTQNKHNSTFSDRVEGAVTLDVAMPVADQILAVTGSKLNIASATASEGRITYEGIVSGNIIYYSAESDVKHSVAVELPFSIGVNQAAAGEGDSVLAKGIVTSMHARIMRGNEIQIKADIDVEILVNSATQCYIVKEVTEGEERILPTSAFSVHIAKEGEKLWDIAKSLGLTPESVLEQNATLTLPTSGGERVMCYRQRQSITM